jgi:hypothetical protein
MKIYFWFLNLIPQNSVYKLLVYFKWALPALMRNHGYGNWSKWSKEIRNVKGQGTEGTVKITPGVPYCPSGQPSARVLGSLESSSDLLLFHLANLQQTNCSSSQVVGRVAQVCIAICHLVVWNSCAWKNFIFPLSCLKSRLMLIFYMQF